MRQYTHEFKEQAVRLVSEQGVSISQAARDLRSVKDVDWCTENNTPLVIRPQRVG